MPKSMIFRPPVGSMRMFCGLMSRWITPTSCAAASPAQICLAMRSPTRSRADVARPRTRCLSVSPFDELHREVAQAARLAEVVGAQDVRVRDAAREPDLLLEPVEQRRVGRKGLAPQRLDRHEVVELPVVRPVDDAHAALAEHALDLVAAGEERGRLRLAAAPAECAVRPTSVSASPAAPIDIVSDATYCSSAAFSRSSSSIARKERARMPISSLESTGRSAASRLPTRTCSVARTSRSTPARDPPREDEGQDERDDERGEADEDWMFWIWRKGASSRSRLRSATAEPTSWSVEERIGRKYARYVSPEIERQRPDRLALPQDRLHEIVSSLDRRHYGPRRSPHRRRGESRLRRLGRLRRVGEEHDLRVQQPLEARRHLVVDLERGGDHARQPRCLPRGPAPRRRGTASRPRARFPRSARPAARPRSSARSKDPPSRGGAGRCARAPRPAGSSRSGSPRGRSTPARASGCRRPSRDPARPSRARASTSSRSCRRC